MLSSIAISVTAPKRYGERFRTGRRNSVDRRVFQVLVQESGDAILLCDTGGKIRFCNRAAERVFGYMESEAIGQSLDIIIPERLGNRHWEGYWNTLRSGTSKYATGDLLAVPAITKDGSPISINFSVVMLRDSDARVVAVGATIHDVTVRFLELRRLRKQSVVGSGTEQHDVDSP